MGRIVRATPNGDVRHQVQGSVAWVRRDAALSMVQTLSRDRVGVKSRFLYDRALLSDLLGRWKLTAVSKGTSHQLFSWQLP
jgi:hypothetical protein